MKFVHEFVALVNAFMVLGIIIIWTFQTTGDNPGRLAQEFILLPPLSIICLALLNITTRVRVTGYLVVGVTMIPMALAGLTGGWGITYIVSVWAIYMGLQHEWDESRPESEKRAERWKRRHFPPA